MKVSNYFNKWIFSFTLWVFVDIKQFAVISSFRRIQSIRYRPKPYPKLDANLNNEANRVKTTECLYRFNFEFESLKNTKSFSGDLGRFCNYTVRSDNNNSSDIKKDDIIHFFSAESKKEWCWLWLKNLLSVSCCNWRLFCVHGNKPIRLSHPMYSKWLS